MRRSQSTAFVTVAGNSSDAVFDFELRLNTAEIWSFWIIVHCACDQLFS